MCIRDRNNRLTLGKNTEVTESKIWQEKIEEIIEFQDRQSQEIISVEPVSYTHLDVYKRQVYIIKQLNIAI